MVNNLAYLILIFIRKYYIKNKTLGSFFSEQAPIFLKTGAWRVAKMHQAATEILDLLGFATKKLQKPKEKTPEGGKNFKGPGYDILIA